ncbi:MAG: YopX family protein [Agathobacter sp.]
MIIREKFLYRAKRADKDAWVEGFLFQLYYTGGFSWCIGNEPLSPNDYSELSGEDQDWFIIDPSTICQATGLHDATGWEELTREEQEHFLLKWNSKEDRRNTKEDWHGRLVFENDIISLVYDGKAYVYKVVWDESELDFKATNGKENYGRNFQYLTCCEDVKVLGNSFDNPNLMEVRL